MWPRPTPLPPQLPKTRKTPLRRPRKSIDSTKPNKKGPVNKRDNRVKADTLGKKAGVGTQRSRPDGRGVIGVIVVAAPLVALHVASDAERLAAAGVRALEGLLARVGVAVDAERARAGEGLVAGLADVTVLALREGSRRRRRDVVVVLPRVGPRGGTHAEADWHGRELLNGVLVGDTLMDC